MLRNPNSIPKDDVLIEDSVMEPFFITKSKSGGFTVFERVVKGEKNTAYIRTVCYPSTFTHALKTVAKELLNSGEKTHFTSVRDYIKKWEDINEKMNQIINFD